MDDKKYKFQPTSMILEKWKKKLGNPENFIKIRYFMKYPEKKVEFEL